MVKKMTVAISEAVNLNLTNYIVDFGIFIFGLFEL